MVLRRQAGVISRAQALAAGMSSTAISRLVSRGAWWRVHPRVYLATDHPLTNEVRLFAAVLWAGSHAAVSGVAAAWWHGLWPEPGSIVEVTVPPGRQLIARPGTQVRRRNLPDTDVVETGGVRVTGLALTVLEAAVALGDRGSTLLDRALQRKVGLPSLIQAHHRNLGRRGSAAAAALLRGAVDRAASEAERILIGLLRGAGLTGWQCGYQAGGYTVDIAFPSMLLAIEVDGWAWHSDVERFRRDRQRQNALVLAGWTILRFTWHDLTHQPWKVSGMIANFVNARPNLGA